MEYKPVRVIISGGGTGGHIFPAISIASRFKEVNPESEILFVGAEGRMEMEKVPAAGFRIVGLKVAGLQRKRSLKNILENLKLPIRFAKSIRKARHIIKEFKPDIAIGVGGYASAPLLFAATEMKIPTLIQEQNGFAGLTNKMLGRRVNKICVAYEGMEKFFPADKIVLTGNPIRKLIVPCTPQMKAEGIEFYGMDPDKKHLLIVGGSLGSGTLNNSMKKWISDGCPASTWSMRSENSFASASTSAAAPLIEICSPRKVTDASKESSMRWAILLPGPTRSTISTPWGISNVMFACSLIR